MLTFKCKMCGGELEFEQGASVAECPFCGTQQTLPKLDDDRRTNLYDRANHFRRQNEYDKAMALFEKILQEDRTDAEAYWSLVLCRYGIEYVADPATGKRIPTVNRVQYASVLADEDYKSALQYADSAQREVYKQEAETIDGIQKGILAISSKEKPFDVFICYKETDANGRRTPDSVLANDLYHQLTNEGFKVFFSRITLEDKIGTAYEPYIFAALNSAKVMVVLGTKPEYFTAVWVKNEWSRFLALIKSGVEKTLVPAYKDMDPYNLPEEFSHLQAQDMSKLGFMQDLIRGIKKLTQKDEPAPAPAVQVVQAVPMQAVGNATVDSLMRRAELFMEDGDFNSANEYLDKVLDIDPEYAPAYLGKVQVSLKVRKAEKLSTLLVQFERSGDWQKAMRFATPEQRKLYQKYLSDSENVRDINRKENIYNQALQKLNSVHSTTEIPACLEAEKLLVSISGFKDSVEQIQACKAKINSIRQSAYDIAVEMLEKAQTPEDCDLVAGKFQALSGFIDSANREKEATAKAEQLRKERKEKIEQERKIAKAQLEKDMRKKRKFFLSLAIIAVSIVLIVVLYIYVVKPAIAYKSAASALNSGEYDSATLIFESLGNYRDAEMQVLESQYLKGMSLLEAGKYDSATEAFEGIAGYNDAVTMAQDSQYRKGMAMMEAGQYDSASETFEGIATYSNAETMVQENRYLLGMQYLKQSNLPYALLEFRSAQNYKDSTELANNLQSMLGIGISASYNYTAGLRADGTVVAVGDNKYGQCDVGDWTDIVAISTSAYHTAGLRADGTVVAVGDNDKGQCDVSNWTDIIAVSAGYYHTVGLRADGTVVAVGDNDKGQCDVGDWTDIVAIRTGAYNTIGLRADGTVVAVGDNDEGQCDVSNWTDIIAISAGYYHTAGLRADGTVVAVGYNKYDQCDVGDWTDIVAISATCLRTVGLRSDGTVVAVGDNDEGQCDVSNWTDIIAVSAGYYHTVGLRADGTVVAVGDNDDGQCDVRDWTLWP